MFRHPPADNPTLSTRSVHMDWALLLVAGAYALLPFGRLAMTGSADQVDMGVATIVLVLVLSSVIDSRRRRSAAAAAPEEGS